MLLHILYRLIIFLIFALIPCGRPIRADNHRPLQIGILRHLTIQDAERLGMDTTAERLLFSIAQQRGHQIEMINPLDIIYCTDQPPYWDVIISRAEMESFADNLTDAYFRALDHFHAWSIPVINTAQATLNAQDKFRTLLLAQNAGISIPRTFLVNNPQKIEALLAAQEIEFPFFIKNPYGGCGRQVFLAKNQEQLQGILRHHFSDADPILIQERIDLETDDQGNVRDMRIWVVRHPISHRAQFLGGAWRTASKNHYLTNISAGGSASQLPQPYAEDLISFSERALDAIHADAAGIDVARDKEGNLFLLEINISFYTPNLFFPIIGVNVWEYVIDLAEIRAAQRVI